LANLFIEFQYRGVIEMMVSAIVIAIAIAIVIAIVETLRLTHTFLQYAFLSMRQRSDSLYSSM
jgi:hypothetical protein